MRQPLRTALVGFGTAGSVFHAPLIQACQDLTLAGVVTRDPARRRAVSEAYPLAQLCDSADEIFANANSYDLVVIATPHESHLPLAAKAIEAGLPVVIDKPLALSATEARRFADHVSGTGGMATVFHNRRWDGDFLTVARLVADYTLGRVHRFESRFDRWRPEPRAGAWRETRPVEEGGGSLHDLGSHLIDQAVHLFGPVRTVYAELDSRRDAVTADDDVFLALQHEGGVRSHLWASAMAADHGPRFRVSGSKGAYVKSGMDCQEAALREGTPPAGDWSREDPDGWGTLFDGTRSSRVETQPGRWDDFYPAVARSIRQPGLPMPVSLDEVVHVLEVAKAARESALTGATVRCERTVIDLSVSP
ncbi:Gfo/Idh/MocA family oxidoreductase [Streptomyces sp. NPDC005799]|uniref:Gfo/Idh/MocA family protein n=1 Tax=Streptomyces sp. NPDC005799 TaxID=3154678 RepID=UPI0033BFBD40